MTTQIRVPELGESVVEATVGRWLKNEGDQVQAGDVLVELETDKVNLEVGAEGAGVLARIERREGQDVKAGDVLGTLELAAEPAVAVPPAQPTPPPPVPEEQKEEVSHDGDRITPVARRLAEERGIDLSQVTGSGPGGRVTKQDIEDFDRQREKQEVAPAAQPEARPRPPEQVSPAQPAAAPAPRRKAPPAPPAPGQVADREQRVRMSRRRRTIAERLLQAHQSTAMLTTFNEVDMSAVMAMREHHRDAFKEKHGVGLGITSFFVKASIGALRAFPQLNAEIQGEEIVLKRYYDIGIAVGAAEGLVVPVLRDADRMSFAGIETSIKEFAQKAERGSLSIEDLRGGTFTITNGGVFGSLLSTPILNLPQVGILGLHKVEDRPVVFDGQITVRPMMYVALSYDHRIVDGREAVQFLVQVKELIQDPAMMLLEG